MKHKEMTEQKKTSKTTIIDVRSPGEFMSGHVPGSINIPLNEIPHRMEELVGKENIILCCASGNRSGQATSYLALRGIKCENGGSWMDLTIENN